MPTNMKFKNFIKKQDKSRQKEVIEFIDKYTPLMKEGNRKEFGIKESPMKMKEALNTKDASVIMTKVMEGVLEKSAEPLYIASNFFKKINLESGNRLVFPAIGALRAFEMAEEDEYRRQTLDILKKEKATEVTVKKHGLMVPITEEMIEDSQWEVVGMHIEAAGRAMARLKEEKMFKAMSKHGHTTFDNSIRDKYPEAGTTGRDANGKYNDSLALEDMMDIIISLMANGYMPTDVLIHPLTWSVFMKNGMMDMFDKPALGGDGVIGEINTDASQGRLPVSLNVVSSPFIPFDKENKTFDMYAVDRNNVGVEVTKEGMTTDQFSDPYRDIFNLKFKERYGLGILDEGKACSVAKNISLAPSFEQPELIRTVDNAEFGQ